ncbi:glycosyltransferase family 4 protein [Rubellimicrobium sp. CFH 75288]|uniref:glycosyltransferase family 4 protein n=1 Tax=Rubellimicrobium sp. CFH 75288 TaxID=2697034 RepID=UPI0014132711|nr:glycosyltransferase family 4 protein [Rubellimicrobium sp. CFH 75288]NAZ35348.1 glycosyltransferase [Rubellimicrobium sp. CFH 75288]
MSGWLDPAGVAVIAPNLKRRLSGVTSTLFRLAPLQARDIPLAVVGPALPPGLPRMRLSALPLMPRRPRVWHARRNSEMLLGLALRAMGHDLRLVFTSASQRRHTRWTRALIARMDAVVATSSQSAAYLERPAFVIPHGIDAEAFRPAPDRAALRRMLGLPEAGPILGCFGRIRAQKGTDLFVDAVIAALAGRPDGAAVVLGRATPDHRAFLDGLRARVAAAGLGDRILFRGEVPVDQVARWYAVLDLFVAPQRWEGFGVTPLEAMACGVPVLATDAGAFPDLVVPGETGLLVPRDDGPALSSALTEALSDPARLARWGEAGRARVLSRFRLEDEAAALNALYRRLLGEGAGATPPSPPATSSPPGSPRR